MSGRVVDIENVGGLRTFYTTKKIPITARLRIIGILILSTQYSQWIFVWHQHWKMKSQGSDIGHIRNEPKLIVGTPTAKRLFIQTHFVGLGGDRSVAENADPDKTLTFHV
jgi:hypothetical protein